MQDWRGDFQFHKRGMRKDRKIIVAPRNEAFMGRVRAEGDTKEIEDTQPLPQELMLNRVLTWLISSIAGIYWVLGTHTKLS